MSNGLRIEDVLDFLYDDMDAVIAKHRKDGNTEMADLIAACLSDGQIHVVSRYDGIGSIVTFVNQLSGGRLDRNFVLVPDSGKSVFANNIGDIMEFASMHAATFENTRVHYTWWLPPNPNAHGEAKHAWTMAGQDTFDFTTRVEYLRRREAQRRRRQGEEA
jgi:hypothetical protein